MGNAKRMGGVGAKARGVKKTKATATAKSKPKINPKLKPKASSKPLNVPLDPATVATKADRVLNAAVANAQPLADALTIFFTARHPEQDCLDLGARTQAIDVLSLTTRWVPEIAKRLKRPKGIVGYGEDRFTFLVGCAQTLLGKFRTQRGSNRGKTSRVTDASVDRDAAHTEIDRLRGVLSALAGRDPAALNELQSATQFDPTEDPIASELKGLAALAASHLSSGDEGQRLAAVGAGLTQEEIDAANRLADRIATTAADVTIAGKRIGKDSPEVNIVEGRTLFELRVAYDAIATTKRTTDPSMTQLPSVGKLARVFRGHHAARHVATPPGDVTLPPGATSPAASAKSTGAAN